MNNKTGIIRKLDDVGRIVIPKEIRKYLRLEEGSPLEIGINDSGEVVLRTSKDNRYILEVITNIGDVIYDILHYNIIFVKDREVYKSFGVKKEGCIDKQLLNVIADKITYFACTEDKTTIYPIIEGEEITYNSLIIVPMDMGMSLVAYSKKDKVEVYEIKFLELVAKFMEGLLK